MCFAESTLLLVLVRMCLSQLSLLLSDAVRRRCVWDVLGNTKHKNVRIGNMFASRCSILIRLAIARGVTYFIEQPSTSLLSLHPRMSDVARLFLVRNTALRQVRTLLAQREVMQFPTSCVHAVRPICFMNVALPRCTECIRGWACSGGQPPSRRTSGRTARRQGGFIAE